jgi:hypothetical protein
VKSNWDDNDVWTQALILAYDQTCGYDEIEEKKSLLGAGGSKQSMGKGRRKR